MEMNKWIAKRKEEGIEEWAPPFHCCIHILLISTESLILMRKNILPYTFNKDKKKKKQIEITVKVI